MKWLEGFNFQVKFKLRGQEFFFDNLLGTFENCEKHPKIVGKNMTTVCYSDFPM